MKKFFMIKKIIFLFLILSLITQCGIYRKTDARKIPVNVNDRVQKNLEQGKRIRFGRGSGGSGSFDFATSNAMWRATIEILDFLPAHKPLLVTKLKIPPFPDSSPEYQFCTVEYFISAESKAINSTIAACNWFLLYCGAVQPSK